MIKLTEANRILKEAYISLINKELKSPSGKRVVCIKCGRSDKTLRKIENGYVCNDCLNELKEQQNGR